MSLTQQPPTTREAKGNQRWSIAVAAGIAAGPVFVALTLAQAFTRAGFNLAEHPLSQLAIGPHGWIQTANFLACGAAFIAAALGERHTTAKLTPWTRRMVITFGAALVTAGLFPTDPWHGYPLGAEEITTWHGIIHNAAAAIAGLALLVATVTTARNARRHGKTTFALGSLTAGIGYFALSITGTATENFAIAFAAGAIIWCWASVLLTHTQTTRR